MHGYNTRIHTYAYRYLRPVRPRGSPPSPIFLWQHELKVARRHPSVVSREKTTRNGTGAGKGIVEFPGAVATSDIVWKEGYHDDQGELDLLMRSHEG